MSLLKLTDVAKINMGQSPSSETYNSEKNGLPFYQGNVDFGEKYPTARVWCDKPTKIAEPGDILISVRAPIGALNYANEKCCIGRGLAAITPNSNMTSSEFIYWLLRAKHSELNRMGTGSTFKAINRKTLENIALPKYNKSEHYHIAEILSKIDGQLARKKAQMNKLDSLIKARFVEMFGDKDFETKPFKDVCEELFAGGDVKKDRTVRNADTSHPYAVFTNGEKDGGLYGYTDMARVKKPSITISGRGTIGFCLVRTEPFYPAIRLIVATPKEDLVTPSYLKHFIDSKDYSGRGASIPQLTIPMIKDEPVPIPPIEAQKEFESFIAQVDKSKFALSNELAMGNFYVRLIHDRIVHGCIDL